MASVELSFQRMSFPNRRITAGALGFLLASAVSQNLCADAVALHPVADTSLIQVAPDANLGGAEFFNAGTAGNGNRNRGLMQFSLLEDIPAGSIINNVYLSLDIIRQPSVDVATGTFVLRRMLTSWGEGDKVPADESSPGQGAPATQGEATWQFRFVGGPAWSAPGGLAGADFAAAPSSTAYVYGAGDPVEFESTPELTADVQLWLDHPDANNGWMLMPEDEVIRKTARSFLSSEDPSGGPLLVIDFTPVPEPGPFAILGLSLLAFGWRRLRRD
jgi:hypothetical protein